MKTKHTFFAVLSLFIILRITFAQDAGGNSVNVSVGRGAGESVGNRPENDAYIVRNPTSNTPIELCRPESTAAIGSVEIISASATNAGKNRGGTPLLSANWSDPNTWGGAVPQASAKVIIPAGKTVVLDIDTPNIASLEINGTLEVARKDLSLTAGYIIVSGTGQFIAGSKDAPFANKLTITLTGTDRQATSMGGRVFGVMGGGKLELLGKIPSLTWTMLAPNATANKNDIAITLESAPGWRVGDEIIITTTDFDYAQTEKRTITGINGSIVFFTPPLNYLHYGVISRVNHNVAGVPQEIDERAEVGLLSHYIKIQGAQGIPGIEDSETNGYGGHVMIMDDASVAHIQGVEFYNMGQKGLLGRYPMHWHNVNDGGTNSYIVSSSVHHSFNRGTTIHKTNNLTIGENVIYDTLGHGYFIEDGKETGNILTHNLVALVRKGPLDVNFIVTDSHTPNSGAPAAFWITNPNNTFINNAAAGVYPGGFGFWYDLHSVPRPGSISEDVSYSPMMQPFGVFRGNRAHSIASSVKGGGEGAWGFFMDILKSPVPAVVDNFTSFKNQGGQVWFTGGTSFTVKESHLSGDLVLFNPHLLKDSLAVGRTANPLVRDPDEWSRNINLQNFDPTIGRVALAGYDFVARAERSVFANYRGVFNLRRDNDQGGGCRDCTFLNDANYKTYFIGNVDNLSAAEAQKSMFTMEDVEDSFGNGAPGLFTYTELFTDGSSKKVDQGAKGIAPDDHLAWWSPFSESDFVTIGFDNRERFKDGASVYQVFIQPEGKTRLFAATPGSDFNGGEIYRIVAKLDAMQKVTFVGSVNNANLTITIEEGAAIKNYERYLLLALPAPSSVPTYSSSYYGTVNRILLANTMTEFFGSNLTTVFLDKANALLYVKLHAPEYLLNISGYTLPQEVTMAANNGLSP